MRYEAETFLCRNLRHWRRQTEKSSREIDGVYWHSYELQRFRMHAHRCAIQKHVHETGKAGCQTWRLGKYLSALHRVLCSNRVYTPSKEERTCKDSGHLGKAIHSLKRSLRLRIEQQLRLIKVWKQNLALHSTCLLFDLLTQNHLRRIQIPQFSLIEDFSDLRLFLPIVFSSK